MDQLNDMITLASHVCTLLACLVVAVTLFWSWYSGRIGAAVGAGLVETLAASLTVIGVERLYYIIARALAESGPDLWDAHPAPELLSGAVGLVMLSNMLPLLAHCVGAAWRTTWLGAAYVAVWLVSFGVASAWIG